MKNLVFAAALCAVVALMPPIEARPAETSPREPAYLLIDAVTERVVDARWDDPDRPLPFGSLIKPFTAVAYAGQRRSTYPTFTCRGGGDGCWLPAGHGHIGLTAAVAGSCNAYFRQLAALTSPDAMLATLQWFGMRADAAAVTPATMVGLGDALRLRPAAVAHGYLELVSRASQPAIAPIVRGLMESATAGTGRAVGTAIGGAGAFVKTGTAPCVHAPKAGADGYTVVVYPADRPRFVLLVQAHGHTGADTARIAGDLLTKVVSTR
jgi:cell division protein FtsI/penicillin-binding protein 2